MTPGSGGGSVEKEEAAAAAEATALKKKRRRGIASLEERFGGGSGGGGSLSASSMAKKNPTVKSPPAFGMGTGGWRGGRGFGDGGRGGERSSRSGGASSRQHLHEPGAGRGGGGAGGGVGGVPGGRGGHNTVGTHARGGGGRGAGGFGFSIGVGGVTGGGTLNDTAPDAVWYAPLGRHATAGVMSTAHARKALQSANLSNSHNDDDDDDDDGGGGDGHGGYAQRDAARTSSASTTPNDATTARASHFAAATRRHAWIEQYLRDLVATNPKTGADAESIIRSKTKDKVLLLDSANASFSVEDIRAARAKRVAASGGGGGGGGGGRSRRMSATEKRRRGFLTIPQDKRRRELYQPLHELWVKYAASLLEDVPSADEAEAERRMRRADLHGAEVRVDACSCPSRVGVTGVVARDTAKTLQLICAFPRRDAGRRNERVDADDGADNAAGKVADVLVVVPKRGALFSLEVPCSSSSSSSSVRPNEAGGRGGVKEGAGGDRDRRPLRVVLRGDDLAR